MNLSPKNVEFFVLPMETRFPFQYGIASMTALPHLVARAQVEIDGKTAVGIASEGLPPKWFTKNPSTTFEEQDLPDMLAVIRKAADLLTENASPRAFGTLWKDLQGAQVAWAEANGYPPLLASLGTSLMERVVLDALCRYRREPLHAFVDEIVDLGNVHPELAGTKPSEFLPSKPANSLIARHTVGLGDPLDLNDVAPENGVDDGLPYTLVDCIHEYGLRYFKIKICGDLEKDTPRLWRLAEIFEHHAPPDYRFTLDGNEQYQTVGQFREHWDILRSDPQLTDFFEHLLFVEQPLHRDVALEDEVAAALSDWRAGPRMIIDESDGELSSLPRALDLGYAGTSHKNCKGIVKGIANACLLEARGANGVLSGEDLANVGPIALLQDLAVMTLLGITHVERNGHHYFQGLSMWPEAVQKETLRHHGDLYHSHKDGYPALHIEAGAIHVASVNRAPFGCAPLLDVSTLDPLAS